MPKETTSLSPQWQHNTTSKGKSYSLWLREGKTKSTLIRTACDTELNHGHGGWTNVKSHGEQSKHLRFLKDALESGQLKSSNTTKSSSINNNINESLHRSITTLPTTINKSSYWPLNNMSDRQLTQVEKVLRAECYWTMAVSQLGFSCAAAPNMPQLFAAMFPDSRIAADLAKTDGQRSPVVVDGIVQFFVHELVKDVLTAPAYSLIFDENTIVGGPKQLDVHIRYWSEYKHGITTRYWRSIVYGNTTSEIIGRYLIDLLKVDGLDLCKLFQLGEIITNRDNMNSNTAIAMMIDKKIRMERETKTGVAVDKGLVSIGSCPLHAIQNVFMNGFTASKWQIDEIVHDFSFFFAQSSARSQDYLKAMENINSGSHQFSKQYVFSRWIEVGSSVERILRQWRVLIEYFITYLPKVNKMIVTNERWKRIKELLERKQVLALLFFFQYLYRHSFWKRLIWLQKQLPNIHILYEECTDFLRHVLQCFVKDDLLLNKTGKQLLMVQFDVATNQKTEAQLAIGESARNMLKDLSMIEKNLFMKDVRAIYSLITRELLHLLPLDNGLLRHLQFTHPLLRQQDCARASVMIVARDLPQFISENEIDRLHAEWLIYENETIPDEWYEQKPINSKLPQVTKYYPIDHYWKHIFSLKNSSGNAKFVVLGKLVKSLLSLSHGNGDIDSDLCENEMFVAEDHSPLNIATINGLRATKDAVRFYAGGKVHEVPISKALLDSVKQVCSRASVNPYKTQQLLK
ncbi:unnamed protein product [Rotaria magnacalcarata]|uniref:Uncharacterized protein n=1 Tax=Rotaria magnacalcarata TaxID=392030 RepID=A0A816SZ28_9BILA|nr:unnamed protein product [Rotaria magnacalcarata]